VEFVRTNLLELPFLGLAPRIYNPNQEYEVSKNANENNNKYFDSLIKKIHVISKKIPNNIYCAWNKCCSEKFGSNSTVSEIIKLLSIDVYGQEDAVRKIATHLNAHLTQPNSKKSLSLLLVGYTGTGKTLTAHKIGEFLHGQSGLNDGHVLFIDSSYHFINDLTPAQNRLKLTRMIHKAVKRCPRALIVLDEVDRLPSNLVDALTPFHEYETKVDGVDFSKAIFLLLSNIAGEHINEQISKFYSNGDHKAQISPTKLTTIINEKVKQHVEGGLENSNIILRGFIDDFIPFRPLERKTVRRCILKVLEDSNVQDGALRERISSQILKSLNFFPDNLKVFSLTGCKKVYPLVNFYLASSRDSSTSN